MTVCLHLQRFLLTRSRFGSKQILLVVIIHQKVYSNCRELKIQTMQSRKAAKLCKTQLNHCDDFLKEK